MCDKFVDKLKSRNTFTVNFMFSASWRRDLSPIANATLVSCTSLRAQSQFNEFLVNLILYSTTISCYIIKPRSQDPIVFPAVFSLSCSKRLHRQVSPQPRSSPAAIHTPSLSLSCRLRSSNASSSPFYHRTALHHVALTCIGGFSSACPSNSGNQALSPPFFPR